MTQSKRGSSQDWRCEKLQIATSKRAEKFLMQHNQGEVRGLLPWVKWFHNIWFVAIKNGEVTWGNRNLVSDRVHQLSANFSLSNVPLLPSENTIKELFDAISIYSANVSNFSGGRVYWSVLTTGWTCESQTRWVGIKDATIINVTGLPNKYGGADKNCYLVMKTKIACRPVQWRLFAKNLRMIFLRFLKVSSISTINIPSK